MKPSSPEKQQLQERLTVHKNAIREKLPLFSQNKQNAITDVIVAGGVLVTAYIVVKKMAGFYDEQNNEESSEKRTQNPPSAKHSVFSAISDYVFTQVLVVTLSILKDKLVEQLRKMNAKGEKTNTDSTEDQSV